MNIKILLSILWFYSEIPGLSGFSEGFRLQKISDVYDNPTVKENHSGKEFVEDEHFDPEDDVEKESEELCPPKTNVTQACDCRVDQTYWADHLYLDCANITSGEDLESVFQQDFPDKDYHEFRISQATLTALDSNYSSQLLFRRIKLFSGPFPELKTITNDFFLPSLRTLEHIYIYKSALQEFPFESLGSYEYLQELHIHYSNISSLPNIQSDYLSVFAVTSSLITEIVPGTFDDARGLNLLDLYKNEIREVKANTFPVATYGAVFNLNSNRIQRIEPGAFYFKGDDTEMEITISLKNNELSTIDEAVFGTLMESITILDIGGNPLDCECDILWLISNADHMEKVSDLPTPKCKNGTLVRDLNTDAFECP